MPYFRVLLEATGVEVVGLENTEIPAIGFFATRLVKAKSVEDAVEKAKNMIASEWSAGQLASMNRGGKPVLRADAVYASSWWASLTFKNRGHAFFKAENGAEQNAQMDRA